MFCEEALAVAVILLDRLGADSSKVRVVFRVDRRHFARGADKQFVKTTRTS
jgi:hypothetical protein